ncbi:hypothetical protein ACFXAF_01720 [Kitasatospora sp. NPDC059463]|uniref:hypothetical protein n=1 Tax=unclassified Kitasatospora TaxID=2633591 RepID=UPI0036AA5A82
MSSFSRTAASPTRPDSTEIATAPASFVEALAGLLAPDAAMVRLDRRAGKFPRTASAFDAQRRHVRQPLVDRQLAARWIVQHFPGLDPYLAHELDLDTGRLTAVAAAEPAAMAA